MKSVFVETLVPNETVTAQFLVLSKEIRQKKTGEPYLSLYLADRTGEIEAKMWDNVVEVMHTFERDHFVKVKGIAQIYNNRSQFTIHKLRKLEDHEVAFSDFFPCSERSADEMYGELSAVIGGIGNAHLRGLLELIFADENLRDLYKIAPAAKSIHHACRSGLIEHVLSLCELGRLTAAHYPEVDRDLLLTGIILHDIGKVEELSYARSFGYSSEGQLLGHIILGLRLLASKFEKLRDFPPRLRTLVEHMILSHHGELEFGSPKMPMFPEAVLLHHLDNLDSKMNAVRSAMKRDRHVEGYFTGWVSSLERVLLRKDDYLNEQPAAQAAKEAEIPAAPVETQGPAVSDVPPRTAPRAPAAPERKPEASRQPMNTLFGDKLQAVLGDRK
ncbi:MAG TPA: HD domain-containing protein [Bryobacteraceae bacterium]|jgi:3'-5' exoribonuclease|nr:HD domain-containing protein [Bryobacteraceae bacterium]